MQKVNAIITILLAIIIIILGGGFIYAGYVLYETAGENDKSGIYWGAMMLMPALITFIIGGIYAFIGYKSLKDKSLYKITAITNTLLIISGAVVIALELYR